MAVEVDSGLLGRNGCRDDSSPTFREKEKERLGLAAAADRSQEAFVDTTSG